MFSFVSFWFIAFVSASFFFVFIDFAFSFNAFRSHKRIRAAFSSTFEKRIKLTDDKCDCTLSAKWFKNLKQMRCHNNLKSVEHLFEKFYYSNKQICLKQINQLRQMFELLSMNDLIEMKKMLWKFIKFEKSIKIFKIERSNFVEAFEVDD
jgi:hypothetical protein